MIRLLLTLLLAAPLAHSQTAPLDTWVGGSGGMQSEPVTFGAGAHVTTGRGSTALRAAFDYGEEFTLGAAPTTFHAASLSLAVQLREGRGRLVGYGGPALVWGRGAYQRRATGPSRLDYQTVGLAVGGAALFDLGPGVAVGLDVSGHINPEVSSAALRVGAHVRLPGR